MEFTKENWESAPEGARLEYQYDEYWNGVRFIGYKRNGLPIIENENGSISSALPRDLRITLPKRKVTVQLWRHKSGSLETKWVGCVWNPNADWTLLGELPFEIEGE